MKKAAGDTKVQKLIGKKKASGRGRGRGRGRGKNTVESPQDENLDGGADNGDENGENGEDGGDIEEPKGESPSTPNGALQERWAAVDSWGCLNKDFFLGRYFHGNFAVLS